MSLICPGEDQLAAVAMDPVESAMLQLQAISGTSGGLGIYRDGSGWVLAQPDGAASAIDGTSPASLGIPVRVVQQAVAPADPASASVALEAIRLKAEGPFGFGHEPAEGSLVVEGEAPGSDSAAIEEARPGPVEFRPGTWALASWGNDGQPHRGGAWLTGGGCGCPSAGVEPVWAAVDGGATVVDAVQGGERRQLVWPAGFSARLLGA